ncbi:MAG: hypothetical protein ACI4A8_04530 [Muribaculaceae bacterium]
MKSIFKILSIISLVVVGLIALVAVCLVILANRPAAPKDYQTTVSVSGTIEKKYMANGEHEVSFHEQVVLQEFEKILVYYPSDLEHSSKRFPVIVICNGSGTPLSRYSTLARHFASWGFIVIGTEEKYSWNAVCAEICLQYLERVDKNDTIDNTKSLFFHKIDFGHVGIVGHSQGGVGVINAITETEHRLTYKAAVSLSPTNKKLANDLFWNYDESKIQAPILLLAGEGGGDDWVISSEELDQIYDNIHCCKLKARRRNTVHGETLYTTAGYVVAWFRWLLYGDITAAEAFIGKNPELLINDNYTDQRIDSDCFKPLNEG